MVMVNVDGSCLMADLQPKLAGLVWVLAATRHESAFWG